VFSDPDPRKRIQVQKVLMTLMVLIYLAKQSFAFQNGGKTLTLSDCAVVQIADNGRDLHIHRETVIMPDNSCHIYHWLEDQNRKLFPLVQEAFKGKTRMQLLAELAGIVLK